MEGKQFPATSTKDKMTTTNRLLATIATMLAIVAGVAAYAVFTPAAFDGMPSLTSAPASAVPSASASPVRVSPGVREAASKPTQRADPYEGVGYRNVDTLLAAVAPRAEAAIATGNLYQPPHLTDATCTKSKLAVVTPRLGMSPGFDCTWTMSDGFVYDSTVAVAEDGSDWAFVTGAVLRS